MTDKEFQELLKAVDCKAIVKEQRQDVRAAFEKAMLQNFQEDVEEQSKQSMRRKYYGQ